MNPHASGLLRRLALLGAVCVVALAAAVYWAVRPMHLRYYTDGDRIRVPAESAPTRDILWKPPVALPPNINTEDEDYEPRVSADGLTLYFVRGKAGGAADIYAATRTPDGWSAPEPLTAINSDHDDLGPELSPDGRDLYFYSDRPGGLGGYDLWLARRGDDGTWRTPVNLGARVNSEFNDYGPALAPDAHTLYFASNRPRPGEDNPPDPHRWPGTIREDLHQRDYDLYFAVVNDSGFADAVALATLNTPHNEGTPAVSPAGDFLYFSSDRPGGLGGYDLYRIRRTSAGFLAPTNLGAPLNSAADELDPGLSLDGYGLHYSSNRLAAGAAPDAAHQFDIYYSVSREVYHDEQTLQRAFNWAWFWATFGPNLLFALLALLLLLLLLALLRQAGRRRLGLLVRCLLASVLVHLLLVVLFNFWQVTAALAGIRRDGPIRVALTSPAVGHEIVSQIRGSLTDVAPPPAAHAAIERAAETLPLDPSQAQARLAHLTPSRAGETALVRLELRPEPAPSAEPAPRDPSSNSRPAAISAVQPLALAAPAEVARSTRAEAALDPLATRALPPAPVHADIAVALDVPPVRSVDIAPAPSSAAGETTSLAPDILLGDVRESTPAARFAETFRPLADLQSSPGAGPALNLALPVVAAAGTTRGDEVAPQPVPLALRVPRAAGGPPFSGAATGRFVHVAPTNDARRTLASPVSLIVPDAQAAISSPAADSTMLAAPQPSPAAPAPPLELPGLEAPDPSSAHSGMTAPSVLAAAPNPRAPRAELASALLSAIGNPSSLRAPVPAAPRAAVLEHAVLPMMDLIDTHAALPRPTDMLALAPIVLTAPIEKAQPLPLPVPDLTPPPIDHTDRPVDSIGTLLGRVSAGATGDPLPGAVVTLELPGREPLTALADGEGWYQLHVPRVPDFFAVTATHAGFIPGAHNVAAADLHDGVHLLDFNLDAARDTLIVLEEEPEVHHLGNDRFEGRVNSQFQRSAEGRSFAVDFELTAEQLAPGYSRARLSMLTKGVQCGHTLVINGSPLRRRLANSPADGSFGEFLATFDAALLREGLNRFEIHGRSCSGDLDDFEFVNLQLQLEP